MTHLRPVTRLVVREMGSELVSSWMPDNHLWREAHGPSLPLRAKAPT
jgi:hypothetical protein